jgi:hypothetical protein
MNDDQPVSNPLADPAVQAWLEPCLKNLLAAVILDDLECAGAELDKLEALPGGFGLFAVMSAFSAYICKVTLPDFKQGDGTLGDHNPGLVLCEDLSGEVPHAAWANRMVAAFGNGDNDTFCALFFAADEQVVLEGVQHMMQMVRHAGRRQLARKSSPGAGL